MIIHRFVASVALGFLLIGLLKTSGIPEDHYWWYIFISGAILGDLVIDNLFQGR